MPWLCAFVAVPAGANYSGFSKRAAITNPRFHQHGESHIDRLQIQKRRRARLHSVTSNGYRNVKSSRI